MSPSQLSEIAKVPTDRYEAADDLLDSAESLEALTPEEFADRLFARFDAGERARFVAQMAVRMRGARS